ncbi:C-C motif chemokine 28 isoform X2 [Chelonoidis abingdonii]|uniref:C-C motif chemokine 28 isoform X2 n=1 Tax=Chelonoidis abingdonii TaxID=106734 RepID=UPI003F491423
MMVTHSRVTKNGKSGHGFEREEELQQLKGMDLKLVTLFAAFAFVVVQTSEATLFLVSFNCCTEVSHHVPRRLLRKVLKFEIQKDDGVCNIPAVILHVKHKKLCVSSHNKTVKKWMKRSRIKNHRRNGNLHSGKKKNTKRKNQIVVKQ